MLGISDEMTTAAPAIMSFCCKGIDEAYSNSVIFTTNDTFLNQYLFIILGVVGGAAGAVVVIFIIKRRKEE